MDVCSAGAIPLTSGTELFQSIILRMSAQGATVGPFSSSYVSESDGVAVVAIVRGGVEFAGLRIAADRDPFALAAKPRL